jgi:hypothetical protein
MIVARICDESGKPLAASGSIKIANYDGAGDGWFPVDSFSFGLHKKEDKSDQGGHSAPHAGSTNSSAGSHSPTPGGGKGGDGERPELSIEKSIDTATCSLMMLVMAERSSKKGVGKKATPLTADIHIITSVARKLDEHFIYTSLMIHLEAVDVKSWTIHGSGDSRPTESVVLRYDRAAMIYFSTTEAKTFHRVGPYGWDQTANKAFDWSVGKMKSYYPPGAG